MFLIEGSLKVKLPTVWTDEKAEAGRVREEKRRKRHKKEDAGTRKGKVAKHCVFPMICGSGDSGGSKSRLAKAAGAEPSGEMRDEKFHTSVVRSICPSHSKSKCAIHTNPGALLEVEMSKKCTPLRREAHVQVKMFKTHQGRSTFGSCDVEKVHAVVAHKTPHAWSTFRSCDVEKVHAVVARSICPSQNAQNAKCSDHFWKLRCWKSARRCGAKQFCEASFKNGKLSAELTASYHCVLQTWRFDALKCNPTKKISPRTS